MMTMVPEKRREETLLSLSFFAPFRRL